MSNQAARVRTKDGIGAAGTHDILYSSAGRLRNTWEKSRTGTRRHDQGRVDATGGGVRQIAERHRSVQVRRSFEPVSGSAGDQRESAENADSHGAGEDGVRKEETRAQCRDRDEEIFRNKERRTVSFFKSKN